MWCGISSTLGATTFEIRLRWCLHSHRFGSAVHHLASWMTLRIRCGVATRSTFTLGRVYRRPLPSFTPLSVPSSLERCRSEGVSAWSHRAGHTRVSMSNHRSGWSRRWIAHSIHRMRRPHPIEGMWVGIRRCTPSGCWRLGRGMVWRCFHVCIGNSCLRRLLIDDPKLLAKTDTVVKQGHPVTFVSISSCVSFGFTSFLSCPFTSCMHFRGSQGTTSQMFISNHPNTRSHGTQTCRENNTVCRC